MDKMITKLMNFCFGVFLFTFPFGASAESHSCSISVQNVFNIIKLDNLDQIECLLRKDVDLDTLGEHGRTALWETMVDQKYSISNLLVGAGADLGTPEDNILLDAIVGFAAENSASLNDSLIRLFESLLINGADINRRAEVPLADIDMHNILFLLGNICQNPMYLSTGQLEDISSAIPWNEVAFIDKDVSSISYINTLVEMGIYDSQCIELFLGNLEF